MSSLDDHADEVGVEETDRADDFLSLALFRDIVEGMEE